MVAKGGSTEEQKRAIVHRSARTLAIAFASVAQDVCDSGGVDMAKRRAWTLTMLSLRNVARQFNLEWSLKDVDATSADVSETIERAFMPF